MGHGKSVYEYPWTYDYSFSSSHVWMWELDYKESWALKNWCFWTVVLEKTLLSPLDYKEIQPVHPKGDQSWIFIGRNDAKAETPVLWPPHVKSWLIDRCWEGLGAGGEGDNRGWDGWMTSPTQWMWVWVNSGRWWWTGRLGVLQFLGSQSQTRLSDWTELNWRSFHGSFFHTSQVSAQKSPNQGSLPWPLSRVAFSLSLCKPFLLLYLFS